jgi:hypothetical protein
MESEKESWAGMWVNNSHCSPCAMDHVVGCYRMLVRGTQHSDANTLFLWLLQASPGKGLCGLWVILCPAPSPEVFGSRQLLSSACIWAQTPVLPCVTCRHKLCFFLVVPSLNSYQGAVTVGRRLRPRVRRGEHLGRQQAGSVPQRLRDTSRAEESLVRWAAGQIRATEAQRCHPTWSVRKHTSTAFLPGISLRKLGLYFS